MAADAGIQPLHAVEDQAVNRVAGGKRQTTENVVIEVGKGVGVIFHFPGAVQYRQRFIRMLTERGANKNRGNIGAYGEQVINQLRHAVVIEARQRFENIQPGGLPEVIHFGGLAMLNGQPAVTRQTLQHFAQSGAGDTDQLRKLAFSGENRSRWEAVIPDALNDILFRETRRALRLNDHNNISITHCCNCTHHTRAAIAQIASQVN